MSETKTSTVHRLAVADEDSPIEAIGLSSGNVFNLTDYSASSLAGAEANTAIEVEVHDGDPDGDGDLVDVIVVREGQDVSESDLSREDMTDGVYLTLRSTIANDCIVTVGGKLNN